MITKLASQHDEIAKSRSVDQRCGRCGTASRTSRGGFGGLYALLGLRPQDVDVTLVDRRNYHPFPAAVYQVATGSLCAQEIA